MNNKLNSTNESIYRAYRLALKSQRRGGDIRAAARKQKAREIIAERYKLPISQVKQIVREFDAINGITHEKNPAEVFMFACERALNEARAKLAESPAMDCPHCGENEANELPSRDRFDEIVGRGRNVSARLDRFAYNDGIARAHILCDACNLVINSPELVDAELVINSAHRTALCFVL